MNSTPRLEYKHGSVDNWQSGKTVEECNDHMLSSGLACDLSILVGRDELRLNVHRYVLISRSCVFAAILFQLNDDADLALPDVEPEDFQDFLMFLYTNKTDITSKNATKLLYVSRKYGVCALEDICVDYLKKHLTYKNACAVLEASHQANHPKLYKRALKMVHDHGQKAIQTPDFITLNNKCVEDIVKSDNLVADEKVVFEAASSWADAECERCGKEPTPRNKRDMLGNVLKCIRFTLMDAKFFVDTVGNSGLLADDERLMIFAHNLFPNKDISPFNKNKRKWNASGAVTTREINAGSDHKSVATSSAPSSVILYEQSQADSSISHVSADYEKRNMPPILEASGMDDKFSNSSPEELGSNSNNSHVDESQPLYNRTENRFRVQSFGKEYKSKRDEQVKFMCRQSIELCGFLLFGPCDDDSASYKVQSHLSNDKGDVMPETIIDHRYSARKQDVIFEVIFPSCVDLAPSTWYTLHVKIRGPASMYGSDVKDSVISHGVKFEFKRLESKSHGVDKDQVPYLLFRK